MVGSHPRIMSLVTWSVKHDVPNPLPSKQLVIYSKLAAYPKNKRRILLSCYTVHKEI
jgi:hypothetical protein